MLYTLVELNRAAMAPVRLMAKAARLSVQHPIHPMSDTDFGKTLVAMTNIFESATRFYGKPDWQLDETRVNSVKVPVEAESAWRSPWCNLVHFKRDEDAVAFARGENAPPQPRLVIVAPLSGHYATLLRGTVEAFLPTHEVYITDWTDARMAPVWLGRFDLDDYIDTIRNIFTALGPGANALAVCQPGPPTLAAISLMAEDDDPNRPATMTFMGSPIDCRKSPTTPNLLAEESSFEWFEQNMIYTVPGPWPGMGRRVYPGFVQLSSFMNMNWDRHVDAHWRFFNHLVDGDGDGIEKHRTFYDEYLAVLDLTEEFYLQTIQKVFQEHHLARGMFRHRGRLVKPSAICDVALMTVEGENDDISGIGQTQAAHDLCTNIPEDMQLDYIQPGVGHYGVFNGSRFKSEIVPRVNEFIARFGDESRQATARRQSPTLRRVV